MILGPPAGGVEIQKKVHDVPAKTNVQVAGSSPVADTIVVGSNAPVNVAPVTGARVNSVPQTNITTQPTVVSPVKAPVINQVNASNNPATLNKPVNLQNPGV